MDSPQIQQLVEKELLSSYDSLYRLAYSYVKNEPDAMDIVQESAYKAIKYSSSLKAKSHVRTWIWRITINTSLEFLRQQQREVPADMLQEQGQEDRYRDFDTLSALDVLNEKERAVIILRYFEDRKLHEIAHALEENINTTKTAYPTLAPLPECCKQQKQRIPHNSSGDAPFLAVSRPTGFPALYLGFLTLYLIFTVFFCPLPFKSFV